MKKSYISTLFVSLFLIACGDASPCAEGLVETSHRVCVDTNSTNVDIGEVELVFDIAIEMISSRHAEDVGSAAALREKIANKLLTVRMVNAINNPNPEGITLGQTKVDFGTIDLAWTADMKSVLQTPLAHELIHMILGMHDVDTESHIYKDYFLNFHEVESYRFLNFDALEYRISTQACKDAGVDLRECFNSGLYVYSPK